MSIRVEIVALDRRLVSDTVDMVTLPGIEGQMGILGGHAPLLSLLDFGEIMLHRGGQVQYV
ncbi:MAG: F0F1 ATP synthase subunit epsilon, partial [Caldilineaceae bacterium]